MPRRLVGGQSIRRSDSSVPIRRHAWWRSMVRHVVVRSSISFPTDLVQKLRPVRGGRPDSPDRRFASGLPRAVP